MLNGAVLSSRLHEFSFLWSMNSQGGRIADSLTVWVQGRHVGQRPRSAGISSGTLGKLFIIWTQVYHLSSRDNNTICPIQLLWRPNETAHVKPLRNVWPIWHYHHHHHTHFGSAGEAQGPFSSLGPLASSQSWHKVDTCASGRVAPQFSPAAPASPQQSWVHRLLAPPSSGWDPGGAAHSSLRAGPAHSSLHMLEANRSQPTDL